MNLDKLKQKMCESNKSILSLSRDSGVAYATLYDILNGKAKNPTGSNSVGYQYTRYGWIGVLQGNTKPCVMPYPVSDCPDY